MYWQETKSNEHYIVPDDIVDVAYRIQCQSLPVDHAYALSQAIIQVLPWFAEEKGAGLHTIHVADSGNGWMRPENPNDLLYLSRRTKLVLRLPHHRTQDAQALSGMTLDILGNSMRVETASVKPLSTSTTVFSRYVVCEDGVDESAFMQYAVAQLEKIGIRPKKMLCGIDRSISTPDGPLLARSLMLAELSIDESVNLQRHGLGSGRTLGCGVFIPHKDIKDVRQALE